MVARDSSEGTSRTIPAASSGTAILLWQTLCVILSSAEFVTHCSPYLGVPQELVCSSLAISESAGVLWKGEVLVACEGYGNLVEHDLRKRATLEERNLDFSIGERVMDG